jgi:hypothetical protein
MLLLRLILLVLRPAQLPPMRMLESDDEFEARMIMEFDERHRS